MPADPVTALLDGSPAGLADLVPLAFAGYAHFSAMQVRDRKVRGLDLHLDRLRVASHAMFGRAPADEEVRAQLRTAIDGASADCSLTVTMFSRTGEFTARGDHADPGMLVRTAVPSTGPAGPLRLTAVDYERPLPTIKHAGEVAKTWYLRDAVRQGFDDAAFVDRDGRLSEATIWNLVFWDGDAVIWPKATILAGVTMGIVRRQLDRLGVAQHVRPVSLIDLAELAGAAVMNSWTPGIAVEVIGGVAVPSAAGFLERLHEAYAAEPEVAP